MRVAFFHSDKPREHLLADAFADGVLHLGRGDEVIRMPLTPEIVVAPADVAVMVGVKSRELFYAHTRAGIHVIMVDKGYTRHAARGPVKLWEYWRCSVDSHHPTERLMEQRRPTDRLEQLAVELKPWRPAPKGHIVLAGSSQKYHDFYGMKDPTRWATKVVARIAEICPGREIVYRPKPSWKDAVPIEGTRYSIPPEDIHEALHGAHALVTHGSNACFEAVCDGVPCIVLGEAVAKPISSQSLEELAGIGPLLVSMPERRQWAANLAYCQWTMAEFASGQAWSILRPQIYG